MAGWLQALVVLGIVGALHVPLGDYMARTFTSARHWRAERLIYRACGINPEDDQRWPHYAVSVLAVSGGGVLLLYLLLRAQAALPFSFGHPGMSPALAFNTAVSFTTNTSWQNYAGEASLGDVAQAAGLGTEAFLSAAIGLCVALALIRGLVRQNTSTVGNFWVDLVRAVVRVAAAAGRGVRDRAGRAGRRAEPLQRARPRHAGWQPAVHPGRPGRVVGADQADVR